MIRAVRRLASLAVVVASLGGCFKLRQKTTVMPDGAGKFTLTVGVTKAMCLDGATREERDALRRKRFSNVLDAFAADSQGVAAWSRPEFVDETDGFYYVKLTAWFADVNQLHLRAEASKLTPVDDSPPGSKETKDKKIDFSYSFAKDGDGFRLTVRGEQPAADLGPKKTGDKKLDKSMIALGAAMLTGLEVSEEYELPGAVVSADLPGKDGRRAFRHVDIDALVDGPDEKAHGDRTFVCGPSQAGAAEIAAFKADFAKAKAEWPKLQAERAAAQAETPAAPPTVK